VNVDKNVINNTLLNAHAWHMA